MNRKKNLFSGSAVALIAAIFTLALAGCGLSDDGEKNVTITINNTSSAVITGVYVGYAGFPLGAGTLVGSTTAYDKTITIAAGGQTTLAPLTIPNKCSAISVTVTRKPGGDGVPNIIDEDAFLYTIEAKEMPWGFFTKGNALSDTITLVHDGSKFKNTTGLLKKLWRNGHFRKGCAFFDAAPPRSIVLVPDPVGPALRSIPLPPLLFVHNYLQNTKKYLEKMSS